MTHSPERSAAELSAEYAALTSGAGLVDLGDMSLVEVRGDDRASFLHSLCTNEIRKLPAGAGCEAFLLNVQGKILFHVLVFSGPDSLVLQTVPGHGERLVAHLDRYLIREKVTLADRSNEWSEILLAGETSAALLSIVGATSLPVARLESMPAEIKAADGQIAVWLRRVDFTGGPGFLIDSQRSDRERVHAALIQAGATPCSRAVLEANRIESGFPLYGVDITDKNLPQEVDRDALAISFVKGCYLGQETVARIDALGHVNRVLRGVRFTGSAVPPVGAVLRSGALVIGQVTSSTFSPRLGAPLALAYVRRGHEQSGAKLESDFGPAEVVSLPLVN